MSCDNVEQIRNGRKCFCNCNRRLFLVVKATAKGKDGDGFSGKSDDYKMFDQPKKSSAGAQTIPGRMQIKGS
jgi:hypothetical protein